MEDKVNQMNVGGWRLLRLLGRGGASEVYEAVHAVYGTHRALKLFKPADEVAADAAKLALLQERFVAEGKILATLSHPRVVRVQEYGCTADGIPYFVMDFIAGADGGAARTLADVYDDGVDPDQVAVWYEDLRDGLAYIHSQKIVHRDLKLENVLIGPDGHAVLADFGISRVLDRDLREELRIGMLTRVSAEQDSMRLKMGSRGYFSPELERGEDATPASDWYALGVVVFRLLTGLWYEPGVDVAPVLDTYDPLWMKIVPRLLADRVQARACPSWRELDEKRRMAEAVDAERGLRAAKKARRRALRVAAGAVALALSVAAAAAVLGARLARANARLALPEFSDVCFIPEDAPDELSDGYDEASGGVSRQQFALAIADAWFLSHDVFDDLRAGLITREKAAASLRQLAREVRADRVDADERYDGFSWNADRGEGSPIAVILDRAADMMQGK